MTFISSSSADESHSAGWKLQFIILFHRHLCTPAMSTNNSQLGVALFPSLYHNFYHFTFSGFPFILIIQFIKLHGNSSRSKRLKFRRWSRNYKTLYWIQLFRGNRNHDNINGRINKENSAISKFNSFLCVKDITTKQIHDIKVKSAITYGSETGIWNLEK